MRPQYHLKPSTHGVTAWCVTRLIQLTDSFSVIQYPLDQIKELDEDYWFKNESLVPTCKAVADHMKLVNKTDLIFPIILSQTGAVMDGMHRVVKAYVQEESTIKAVQFTTDPDPDYIDVDPKDLPYD